MLPTSAAQWLLIFYAYCFFGWCFETTVVSVQQRRFVNRGFVRGPMLPLYGTGAVMVLLIVYPFANHPARLFFAGMLAATALEYVTGILMESAFKVKYWDYSTHRFQFQGRICLQSSVAWGFLSLALVHIIHPPIFQLVASVPPLPSAIIAACCSAVFCADVAYAFRTALDLRHVLEELTRLRAEIAEMREDAALWAASAREDFTLRAGETKEDFSLRVSAARDELLHRIAKMREKWNLSLPEKEEQTVSQWFDALQGKLETRISSYEERIRKLHFSRKSLIRAHPTAISEKFGEALNELKERFNKNNQ